jgi:hypothetical protein
VSPQRDAGSRRHTRLPVVVAIATAVSTILTAVTVILTSFTLQELAKANALVRRQQDVTLRPYMSVRGGVTTRRFLRGTPNETWSLSVTVVNIGQTPARNVVGVVSIDTLASNVEFYRPNDIGTMVGTDPTSGITLIQEVSKKQVLEWAARHSAVCLHGNVWYRDQSDSIHVYTFVSQLGSYGVSDTISWHFMNINETVLN